MREFLIKICPVAIWCIVAGEAVIAALLFLHAAKKHSKVALWSGVLTLGLILDAAIIGLGSQLTPEALGALLSHFENKVMFQGFLWNLNSFDQEGVQLGKVLAKRVLAHETDGALKAFSDLLNI